MRYPSRQRKFFAAREALVPGGSADGAAPLACTLLFPVWYAPAKAFGRIYRQKSDFQAQVSRRNLSETADRLPPPPIEPRQAALGETWR